MADLDTADDTMAVDAATAVAPIPATELAWSADLSVDDLALPRPWHAVQRTALGIFAVCIAIAGGVTVADRTETPKPPPADLATRPPEGGMKSGIFSGGLATRDTPASARY